MYCCLGFGFLEWAHQMIDRLHMIEGGLSVLKVRR